MPSRKTTRKIKENMLECLIEDNCLEDLPTKKLTAKDKKLLKSLKEDAKDLLDG